MSDLDVDHEGLSGLQEASEAAYDAERMGDFYVCVNCGETCKGHHDCAMSRPVEYRPIAYKPFDTVAVLLPETPDPRDARIAELEAALAWLVDTDGPWWDAAAHLLACRAAERALGRRK